MELAQWMPDVDFLVLGEKGEVKDLPQNIKLLGRVYEREKMALYYSLSDATILVSKAETFSMPVAESLCCGTPVVGFKAGGPEQIALPEEAIEYVDMFIEATADIDSAKARQQDASNHLKEYLGDYNSAKCLGHTINWKPVSTQRIDTKALAEKYPEIAEEFTKTTISRRFTLR